MRNVLSAFFRDQSGLTTLEFGVAAGVVSLALILMLVALSSASAFVAAA